MSDEEVLVSDEIRKDDQTVVRIQVKEFRGSYYFDIREWKDGGNYKGPTKKGVNIPLERASGIADTVGEVLKKAYERMDEHVKEVQNEEMKKDLGRLKKKYGSHT